MPTTEKANGPTTEVGRGARWCPTPGPVNREKADITNKEIHHLSMTALKTTPTVAFGPMRP